MATALDGLGNLLHLVEYHAQSTTFDYSATNLLAEWIRIAVNKVPALAAAASLVNALGETLQLTSGLAQTEVWNAFRDVSELDSELIVKMNAVRDTSKHSI